MTDEIMKPFVNNNGTPREALVAQRIATRRELNKALEYHRAMAPHGRDYQGGGNYLADRALWRERHLQLEAIYKALGDEALFIYTDQH